MTISSSSALHGKPWASGTGSIRGLEREVVRVKLERDYGHRCGSSGLGKNRPSGFLIRLSSRLTAVTNGVSRSVRRTHASHRRGREVFEQANRCRTVHHPHTRRLDQLPRILNLGRGDPCCVGRSRLVVPAQECESLVAIQPGDEPRRPTTERAAAVEEQERPARRRNIAEPRGIEHEAIHLPAPYPSSDHERRHAAATSHRSSKGSYATRRPQPETSDCTAARISPGPGSVASSRSFW